MREKAEKDYMIWTEKARNNLKYTPALAQLVKDIIENGHTFSREKWESIYKNKDIPWRNNKILQEIMVSTKGFPDDMCEKILSCAFHKSVYKAALAREDLSTKNVNIALAGISERALTNAIMEGELSSLAINQIATKIINRLTYDNEFIPKKHEIKVLEQTTNNVAVKNYLSELEFGEADERIISAFVNNTNLDEETRDFAFDLGCDPSLINSPYTSHMKEINIDGALESYFISSTTTASFLVNSIEQHLIDEDTEFDILRAFTEHKTPSKTFKKDAVLSALFAFTQNRNVAEIGLQEFPSFAEEVIFFNKNIKYNIVKPYMKDELVKFMNKPLTTGVRIRNFEIARLGLAKKMENEWKDVKFDSDIYEQVKTTYLATMNSSKYLAIIPFITSKNMPEKILNDIIKTPCYIILGTSQRPHFNVCKAIAMQSLALKQTGLPLDMSNINVSTYLSKISEIFFNHYVLKKELSDLTKKLVSSPEFLENGEKYINTFENTLKQLKDTTFVKNNGFQDENIDIVIDNFEYIINELNQELSLQRTLQKSPSVCNREEIEIAKNHCLLTANLNYDKDPLSYIMNFEDKKNLYIALCQREQELDIEEGKLRPTSLIEEVFEGGTTVFSKPTTPVLHSSVGIKVDEIYEI